MNTNTLQTKLTHLSLFTGIGGLDLAAEWASFRTVGQCEWADYPHHILSNHWSNDTIPKWKDVHDLSADSFRQCTGLNTVTCISAGFPCQPHSLSGKRMADNDDRDLWPEVRRVLCEIKPRWFVGENVPGLLSSLDGRFFGNVLRDLAQLGYRVGWMCFPAHAVGASFWGERVAIVAAADSVRWDSLDEKQQKESYIHRVQNIGETWPVQAHLPLYVSWDKCYRSRSIERNDDGIPEALDEMKAYGNAVTPQQFYPIFAAIACIEYGYA